MAATTDRRRTSPRGCRGTNRGRGPVRVDRCLGPAYLPLAEATESRRWLVRTLQTNARETGKYIGYRRLLGLASGAGITERQLGDGLGWLCNFGALRHRPVPGKGTRYKIEEEVEWS